MENLHHFSLNKDQVLKLRKTGDEKIAHSVSKSIVLRFAGGIGKRNNQDAGRRQLVRVYFLMRHHARVQEAERSQYW